MKKVFRAIIKFFGEGPSPTSLGGILDSYELCGWSKCPVSNKKKIEEDYSI
jgi:hypothetical protein